MNLLDRLIGFVSPSALANRLRSQAVVKMLGSIGQKERTYDASSNGRRTKNWMSMGWAANTEVYAASVTLRNRSRDLARNNPYARRALRQIPAHVVGSGILPAIKHPSKGAEKKLKAFWKKWSESTDCDFDERKTFAAVQKLAFRASLESGESFIRKYYDKDKGLQLQVLEADHLDWTRDSYPSKVDGGYIVQGIEFNARGKRIAYWMFEQHPGQSRINFKINSIRIPASEIIHIYQEERPEQLRGVPIGTASMLRVRDFDEYEDTELIRQKIAACFAVFVTSEAHGSPSGNTSSGLPLEQVEPGIIERLKPGEKIEFAAPPETTGYESHTKGVLRGIAAGYDVPYEVLTGDLSNVNFSSGRMGKIDFQGLVEEWQEQLMIPVVCHKVWQWFLDYAIIMGVIREKSAVGCTWTAPAREMIDPQKEVKAMVEKVRSGLISWQEAVRRLGYDPEEIMAQLIEDSQRFKSAGLMPTSDPKYDANRQAEKPMTNQA